MTTPQLAGYELSKKLHELGCKSESGFKHVGSGLRFCKKDRYLGKTLVAFSLLDFIGPYEHAIENCKNVFLSNRDKDRMIEIQFMLAKHWQHKLVDTPPDQDAWKIIEEALK